MNLNRKEYQRTSTDCHTCILSMFLDIPYEEVPKFYESKATPITKDRQQEHAWLKENGYMSLTFKLREDLTGFPSHSEEKYYCIGNVQHEGKSHSHSVLLECIPDGEGFILVNLFHDPLKDSPYELDDLKFIQFIYKR